MKRACGNRFPKSERLSLQKDIDRLFEKGKSVIVFPLRIIYLIEEAKSEDLSGISVMVSVPKKRIKHAVGRNRIKRLVREAYRVRKSELLSLYTQESKSLHLAFIYVCDEIKPFTDIEISMDKALKIIREK